MFNRFLQKAFPKAWAEVQHYQAVKSLVEKIEATEAEKIARHKANPNKIKVPIMYDIDPV